MSVFISHTRYVIGLKVNLVYLLRSLFFTPGETLLIYSTVRLAEEHRNGSSSFYTRLAAVYVVSCYLPLLNGFLRKSPRNGYTGIEPKVIE